LCTSNKSWCNRKGGKERGKDDKEEYSKMGYVGGISQIKIKGETG